jgi:integrase
MPVPAAIWEQVFFGVLDLACFGRIVTPRGSFGDGGLVARRHGLAIRWMIACALRFSELRRLSVSDLSHDAVYVHRSKRGRSGMVSVGADLVTDTLRWRGLLFGGGKGPSELLPSQRGTPLDNNAFNRDVCKPLGFLYGFALSSHCWRDTACQLAYVQTSSIRSVQTLLGHRSVQTTEIYLAKQQAQSFRLSLPGG